EHRLESLLEFAAELRARDERTQIEGDQAFVLQAFGDVAVHDALREALDDGGLADSGLADQDRIVLRAAREHLNDATDLLVAADRRIEFALRRRVGEIAGVALQCLILILWILIGGAVRSAHRLERLAKVVLGRAGSAQYATALGALRAGEREELVLGG